MLIVKVDICGLQSGERGCHLAVDVGGLTVGFRPISARSEVRETEFSSEEYLRPTLGNGEPFTKVCFTYSYI